MAIVNLNSLDKEGKGFFHDYLLYTKNQESPEDFHLWTAIGLISSALGRSVWYDRGYLNIYPNLWIVLVAESAAMRKSTALGIGTRLLRSAVPEREFFADKCTTEAMIGFLSDTSKKLGQAIGTIHASEFSVFFGKSIQDPTIIQTLTNLYDCPDVWRYTTKMRGDEYVNDVCISMLAGTTQDWIRTSLPEDAVGGGFTSRMLFIPRTESGRKIAFPEEVFQDASHRQLKDKCIERLREISFISGQYKFSEDGKAAFGEWYNRLYKIDNAPANMRGYMGRKPDYLIKLGMIVSASLGHTLEISENDFFFALKLLNENENYMQDVLSTLSQSNEGKNLMKIRDIIYKEKKIEHRPLQQKVGHLVLGPELATILRTLADSGEIEVLRDTSASSRGKLIYVWKGKDER